MIQVNIRGASQEKIRLFLSQLPEGYQPSNILTADSDDMVLAVDTASVLALWDMAKVTIPAILTAMATLWAAKIAAANKTGGPPRHATIELQTDQGIITLEIPHEVVSSDAPITLDLPKLGEVRQITLSFKSQRH